MQKTNYENVYVDEEGNVYRILNNEYHKLSQWIDNVGYYQVVFRIDGKRKYVRVHRLIAETFIENPEKLPQVNHKDGNKLNNNVSNLEWCTNSANTQHGYDNDLYHSKKRSHQVKAINKETGEELIFKSIRSCAEILELNRKTISNILKGEKKTNNYPYEFQYVE